MALTRGAPPWPLHGRAADAMVAAGVAVVVIAGALFALRDQRPFASADLLSWALIVVALVAVYFRRRWPVAMAASSQAWCGHCRDHAAVPRGGGNGCMITAIRPRTTARSRQGVVRGGTAE